MIKLLISDLDHTLLNDQKQIDEHIQTSIHQLLNAGVEIGLASGRVDSEIKHVGKKFLKHACHRISENGVYVYTHQEEELCSTSLPQKVISPIIELTQKHSFLTVFNVQKQCYVLKKTAHVAEYEAINEVMIHETSDLLDQVNDSFPITKIAVIGDLSNLKQFEQDLKQQFVGKINFYISSPNCLDMVPLEASKGIGMQKLMDKYDLKAAEIACVGDSYNDISMFELTPHSFAMAHGEKQVRVAANYTVKSVTEVADYILKHNQTSIVK